jgi:hypothetical protein
MSGCGLRQAAPVACAVILAAAAAGCGALDWLGEDGPGVYGYLVKKSDPDAIYVVGEWQSRREVYPVTFSEDSDEDMVEAFRLLRAGIRYVAADGRRIWFEGELDMKENTFRLERWYITTPFYEMELEEGERPRTVRREQLLVSDFYEPISVRIDRLQRPIEAATAEKYGGVGLPVTPAEIEGVE